jgi:hypothetical protein
LSAHIRDYLDCRLPASLPQGGFGIVGPNYVTVGISAAIVPADPFDSGIVRDRAVQRLRSFLRPRQGGLNESGWEFGRNVYLSEICAALESVEGVAHSMADSVEIFPSAAQRELLPQTNDALLRAAYPVGSMLITYDSNGFEADRWTLAEPVVTDVIPYSIRVTGPREGDALHISADIRHSEKPLGLKNTSGVDFPAGSRVVFQDGCETILKKGNALPANGMLTADMLDMGQFVVRSDVHSGDHAKNDSNDGHHGDDYIVQFNKDSVVTLVHPDAITVTGVRNGDDGSFEAAALRPSEDLRLLPGLVLECARSKVKAKLAADGGKCVSYGDAMAMTMRFIGFSGLRGNSAPLSVSLTQPDGRTNKINFKIAQSRKVTDTAYLLGRELCAPGEIDIQIAK